MSQYLYTKLSGPFVIKQKYNVFGVVKEICKDIQRDSKNKLTLIMAITDESIQEPFKVSVFCKTEEEEIPWIEENNCIVRLHNMQVEDWGGRIDGRVFCAETDIVVFPNKSDPAEDWICFRNQKVTDDDIRRVQDLRGWMEVVNDLVLDNGL